jgi:uncharacterized membrane protein
MVQLVVNMHFALALTEFALALVFFIVAWQRWKMGLPWAASASFCIGLYFGRIGLLYLGRGLDVTHFESAVRPSLILTNALLVLVAMVLTIAESHLKGHHK